MASDSSLDFLLAIGSQVQTQRLMGRPSVDPVKAVCIDESSEEDVPNGKLKAGAGPAGSGNPLGSACAAGAAASAAGGKPTAKCGGRGRGRGGRGAKRPKHDDADMLEGDEESDFEQAFFGPVAAAQKQADGRVESTPCPATEAADGATEGSPAPKQDGWEKVPEKLHREGEGDASWADGGRRGKGTGAAKAKGKAKAKPKATGNKGGAENKNKQADAADVEKGAAKCAYSSAYHREMKRSGDVDKARAAGRKAKDAMQKPLLRKPAAASLNQSNMGVRLNNALAALKAEGKPHSIADAAKHLRSQTG